MPAPGREQYQDVEYPDGPGQKKRKGQNRKELRSYWTALPRVWKALTLSLSAIAAVVSIIAPLGLIGPSSSSARPTGFQGFVLGHTGLQVRTTPELSGEPVASLQPGATVFIVCAKKGDAVTGPRHG